ncbi:hypothetical protein MBLNU13_g00340t1 [Cladosporium sp. NU13]
MSSVSSTSTLASWDPMELFQLVNPDKMSITCVGYAPSCRRRCRNPIAYRNVQAAKELMRQVVRPGVSNTDLKEMLFDLAEYTLCRRDHPDQATDMSNRWFGMVQRHRDDEDDHGSDTSDDDDNDSDDGASSTSSDSDDSDDDNKNDNAEELRRSGSLSKTACLDQPSSAKHDNRKRTDDQAANQVATAPPKSVETRKKLYVPPSKLVKKQITSQRNAPERPHANSSVATKQNEPNAKKHNDKPKPNVKHKKQPKQKQKQSASKKKQPKKLTSTANARPKRRKSSNHASPPGKPPGFGMKQPGPKSPTTLTVRPPTLIYARARSGPRKAAHSLLVVKKMSELSSAVNLEISIVGFCAGRLCVGIQIVLRGFSRA